jgi:hypothetical protein
MIMILYSINIANFLGPSCSNTMEAIAGVSKHYRTVVVTYMAKGSISNENSDKYP